MPRSSTAGSGSKLVPALLIRICSGVVVSDRSARAKRFTEAGSDMSKGGTAGGSRNSREGGEVKPEYLFGS